MYVHLRRLRRRSTSSTRPGRLVGTGGFVDTDDQRLPVTARPDRSWTPRVSDGSSIAQRAARRYHRPSLPRSSIDHQPLIGDAVINDGQGLHAHRREVPVGQHARRSPRGGRGPGRPEARACRTSTIDAAIFRPATLRRDLDPAPRPRAAARAACWWSWSSIAVPLPLARRPSSACVAIPLSLMAGMPGPLLCGATINTMILAGFVIALGSLVDDAIVDIENVVRRLRQHRAGRAAPSPSARIILEASLEVRQRDRPRHADRSRGADAGLLPRRPVRRLLPAAGDLVLALPRWPPWWSRSR